MLKALLRLLLVPLLTGALAAQRSPEPVAAEPATGEPPAVAAPAPAPPPGLAEVVPRVVALGEEAAEVRQELAELAAGTDLAVRVAAAASRLDALEERFTVLPDLQAVAGDEIVRFHAQTRQLAARLNALLESVSARSRRVDELRQGWQEKRDFFFDWRRRLAGEPGFAAVRADLDGAVTLIDQVLAEVDRAVPAAVALQQQVQAAVQGARDLQLRVEELERTWELELRSRNEPVLFSPRWAAQLGPALRDGMPAGLAAASRFDLASFAEHDVHLLLALILVLLIGIGARRLRRASGPEDRWMGLLARPWALAAFTAVVTLGDLFEPAPPAWRLLTAVVLAGAVSLLAAGTFLRRRKRWPLYLLALLYVIFHACEAVSLPAALYRPLLILLVLAPIPFLLYLARLEIREGERLSPLAVSLRIGSAVLAAVAVAEVAGYHLFARWLLDAALTTAFILFAATFLIRLGRKALQLAFEAAARRRAYLARVAPELGPRLGRLLKVVLAVVAALYIADVWDLADSPGQAWRSVVGWSLGAGDYRLTMGQVLLAAGALYAAVIVSWLLRAFLDEEVVARRGLDRGVGDSIKTLLHYGLIVVGFLFGLTLAGVSLSSFAILAGAFGVGIGFGLQNIVNNFVSGIILLFERPVRSGDTVVIAGVWGTVQHIGLRSTVLQTFDRAELIVPNSQLIAETVTNWTLSNRIARILLPVGVAYGSDYARALEILREVGGGHPSALPEPKPVATLAGFGDSAVNLELRVWVGDIDQRLATTSELVSAIASRFAEAGIEIPFPQRDLHLRSVDSEAAERIGPGERGPAEPAQGSD